jgi:hypothetical protein
MVGLTPTCASILRNSAIAGIYQVGNISLEAFAAIRNFSALNPLNIKYASLQQLLLIPNWPMLPSTLILAAFNSKAGGAQLANSVRQDQMQFDQNNYTIVQNIELVKLNSYSGSKSTLGWDALTDQVSSENPQLWSWIHMATIATKQDPSFWLDRFSSLHISAFAGLQFMQSLPDQLLAVPEVVNYLLPDAFGFGGSAPLALIEEVRRQILPARRPVS